MNDLGGGAEGEEGAADGGQMGPAGAEVKSIISQVRID
jgi:hypothetical protein